MSTKLFDQIAATSKPQWPVHRQACVRIKRALIACETQGLGADLEPETAIIDALADVRHLCDRLRLDFGALDRTAHGHYVEEKGAAK